MSSKGRRNFKRYLKVSGVDLKLGSKSHKAKMINYSVGGVGAVVDKSAQITKGDMIDLSIEEPEIKTVGEVVWSANDKSGKRIGIKNIGKLKGRLKDFRLSDTLIGLQRSQMTGILTVESSNIFKKIYMKNGDMVFSALNQDVDRLGDVLLREGKITPEQFEYSAGELKRSKERQGALLVKLGYITAKDLFNAARHQVEEIILSLFTMENGGFVFEEMPLPAEEVITLRLSAATLIYYGIKRIENVDVISSESFSPDSVLSFSSDPLTLFQDIRLDDPGRRIISFVDGETSMKDLISLTQLDNTEALKTIYALLNIEMLKIKEEDKPFVEIPKTVIDEMVEEKIKGKEELRIDTQIKDMIENTHKGRERLGYYGILGVKDYAPTDEIKAAYYKAAKKFHPDMHFHHADDSLKAKLSDIFSYVYEAYATLSNPEKRKEYDKLITCKPARLTSNQDEARALFEEGKAELRKKKDPEAELLFGQATYFDSTISEYHYYYGLTLMRQNKLKEAERAIGRALKLAPHNADYFAELGFVYLKLEFPARARAFFEKALKVSPHHARASAGLTRIKQ
jgi:tetratricopeptide (TPR) repeat protein